MISATEFQVPSYRLDWLGWIRREFSPAPGREQMTIRLVVTVLLVTMISMALQVPQLSYSAFFVFFVTKENRALTLLTGLVMIIGITVASAISLFLYRFTFDYPELRVPGLACFIFAGMFLSRVFVIGPLGFVVGFFTALIQTSVERAPDTDSLVRGTLWLWIAVIYPVALTVVMNQILLPADPWPALVALLTQRLNTATAALEKVIKEGFAGGQTNVALVDLATRGSSPLAGLLNFAETKDVRLKRRHASLMATIAASEHMLMAATGLEFRERQAITDADKLRARVLLDEIAQLRVVLPESDPILKQRKIELAKADLPQLREMQFAVESFRDGLIRYISEDSMLPAHHEKKRLFIPDAFTNPSHLRFALKVTLAAMICYLLYNGLDWPGISTAFVTCCFISLENTGATIRKGWLRLIGCASGGLLGYFAIFFLIPQMDSATSLLLLTAAGTAIFGWVAAGTDRISYAGLQGAFAFFMCIFQGFEPGTNLTIVRDRLLGIFLGIIVSSIIYFFLWPEHAIDSLRHALARLLRDLAQLLQKPGFDATTKADIQAMNQTRGNITRELDKTLRLSELVVIENVVVKGYETLTPAVLERMTARLQALSIMTTALTSKSKLEEWRELDAPVQQAEINLWTAAAARLRNVAAFVETCRLQREPDEFEARLARWEQAVAKVRGNDRPRLVRRLVNQIKLLN
jgi:multidrug resistance protein MdtO